MSKLLRRPTQMQPPSTPGRYQKYYLTENPFPQEPAVNQESTDKRINGGIYETEIHNKEFKQIEKYFLRQSQSNPNHLRLGYIIDTSYIGRGNGKSAFLINLQQLINREYCLDISDGLNKCFAIHVRPEPGGRTKTFLSLVDVFFQAISRSRVIESALAALRLEAIKQLYKNMDTIIGKYDDEALIENLNSEDWLNKQKLDIGKISEQIYKNEYLQRLPEHFPLFKGRNNFFHSFISKQDFDEYYWTIIKRSKERIEFVFSHLVDFLLAAGFNGAYILVDDFERVPDFQSERQKRDFALELRSCIFDGFYTNARVGFYNFLLVFHAGVPRLISDAWEASGMEHRSPIAPRIKSRHVIRFEKLSQEHASLLLQRYLTEYRIPGTPPNVLFPFKEDAVSKVGELSEYNAARILNMSYELLEKAIDANQETIDARFVDKCRDILEEESVKKVPTIKEVGAEDLQKKARRRK